MDFELMRYMHWSWKDLQECPLYVRKFSWDFMQARIAAKLG